MNLVSIFLNMKVYCVFSFESPHQGDPNEYTYVVYVCVHTIHHYQYKKEKSPKLSQIQ